MCTNSICLSFVQTSMTNPTNSICLSFKDSMINFLTNLFCISNYFVCKTTTLISLYVLQGRVQLTMVQIYFFCEVWTCSECRHPHDIELIDSPSYLNTVPSLRQYVCFISQFFLFKVLHFGMYFIWFLYYGLNFNSLVYKYKMVKFCKGRQNVKR